MVKRKKLAEEYIKIFKKCISDCDWYDSEEFLE